MDSMQCRTLYRLSVFVAVCGLAVSALAAGAQQDNSKRGRKYKAPPPFARIEVTILRDGSGKPIENAAVVFHAMQGEKDKGNMELKTNEDGKTIIDVLPIGDTVRLQIIAKGFQTFGEDYKIDKPDVAIEIRMKRPGEQYSIYKPHPETSEGGKDSAAGKTAAPAKEVAPASAATPPPATDKPADAAKPPDTQPSQPQSK
jgi:5-hydroxyisourate hydrolase-like protein (transthyretin family)